MDIGDRFTGRGRHWHRDSTYCLYRCHATPVPKPHVSLGVDVAISWFPAASCGSLSTFWPAAPHIVAVCEPQFSGLKAVGAEHYLPPRNLQEQKRLRRKCGLARPGQGQLGRLHTSSRTIP